MFFAFFDLRTFRFRRFIFVAKRKSRLTAVRARVRFSLTHANKRCPTEHPLASYLQASIIVTLQVSHGPMAITEQTIFKRLKLAQSLVKEVQDEAYDLGSNEYKHLLELLERFYPVLSDAQRLEDGKPEGKKEPPDGFDYIQEFLSGNMGVSETN
jgi:hypothetical protein